MSADEGTNTLTRGAEPRLGAGFVLPASPPVHIWIVSNTSWYVFNFRQSLIRELVARGYRVTAFAPTDEYVERLRGLGAEHEHLDMDNASLGPLTELKTIWRIARTLRRHRPALLLTHTPKINTYVGIAARLLGIPVVANITGLGRAFTSAPAALRLLSKGLYRIALRHSHRVLFQNRDDLNFFVREGIVPATRVERVPGSGVDIERFRPRAQSRTDGEFRFLLAGRLLRDKGVYEFVAAARRLKPLYPHARWQLLGFVGVPNASALSREDIDRWHAEGVIDFLGQTDRVEDFLARVDCVVLPSYREGLPRSLLEAAACGLPVIATDTTGCRDTVEDGVTGLLCRPRDVDSLVEAMRRMLELDDDSRGRMGRAGRAKIVAEFDERRVIDRYLHLVRRVRFSRDDEFAPIASPPPTSEQG